MDPQPSQPAPPTTYAEAIAFIRELIKGRQHYVVVAASPMGWTTAARVEKHYLHAPAEDRYAVVINDPTPTLNMPAIGLFVGHKKWLTPAQLEKIARRPVRDETHDIILTPDIPARVFNWLQSTFRGCSN